MNEQNSHERERIARLNDLRARAERRDHSISYFYKYQKIDEARISTIAQERIWFSSWADLNDPFEPSVERVISQPTPKEVVEWFVKTMPVLDREWTEFCSDVQNVAEHEGYERALALADRTQKEPITKIMFESFTAIPRHLLETAVVHSLSRVGDSLPMWAHYADNHCGMVVVYAVDLNMLPFQLFPVKYYETFTPVPYSVVTDTASLEWMQLLFGQKSIEWSYEKEYRMVRFCPTGSMGAPAEFPAIAVIFGWKTPRDQALNVWQHLRHLSLVFYQVYLDRGSQKIQVLEFKPN